MKTKITRRRLMAASITAGAGAAAASAQTAPTQAVAAQTDLAKAVREQNQRAGDVLAKFEIPLATEPAFQFKA
jgi:hypothetical protein